MKYITIIILCEKLGSHLKEEISHLKVIVLVQKRVAIQLQTLGSKDELQSIEICMNSTRLREMLRSIFNQFLQKIQVNRRLGFHL